MRLGDMWRKALKRLLRRHGDVKSFEHELESAGGTTGIVDTGARAIPVDKVVGSVNRWRNLRTDFFYKNGTTMTARFARVGEAMRQGKELGPLELYKMKVRRQQGKAEVSEYYVVDGHHRVAMAKKLGQDFLDAHVVEYKLAAGTTSSPAPPSGELPADEAPRSGDVAPGDAPDDSKPK